LALAVAIVGLLGGAAFGALSVAGDHNSPDDAVRQLLSSAHNHDLLGVLESIDPAERDALRQPIMNLTGELKRLKILSSGADLSNLGGFDLTFDKVALGDEHLSDDLTAVTFKGGTVTATVDPSKFPLGDFVKTIPGLQGAGPHTITSPLAAGDMADKPLVTIRKDDHWYVSFGYSIAEAGRHSTHKALPSFGHGVEAAGAPTAEDAVRQFIVAGANLDLGRLIQLMPPDEMAALHDYAPLFLPDAQKAAAELHKHFSVEMGKIDLTTQGSGDESLVKIARLAFSGRAPDGSVFKYDGDCLSLTTRGRTQKFCKADLQRIRDQLLKNPAFAPLAKLTNSHADLGFVTVRRDGKWYLSPVRTVLDDATALTKVLQPSDLDAFKNLIGGIPSRGGASITRPPY